MPEERETHIGKTERPRQHLFGKETFIYNEKDDSYTCPQANNLRIVARSIIKGKYSKREVITYRTERGMCNICSLREKCTTNTTIGRAITRDGYEDYRKRMREKLSAEEGRLIYGKRKYTVEPVLGQIKVRSGFSQFLLRGLEKVKLEWKMAATAHNLLKITAAIMRKERMLPALG